MSLFDCVLQPKPNSPNCRIMQLQCGSVELNKLFMATLFMPQMHSLGMNARVLGRPPKNRNWAKQPLQARECQLRM